MRRRQMGFVGGLSALIVQVGPALAAPAASDAPLQVAVGAGALYRPDYPGSDDYKVRPLPFVVLRYERAGYTIVVGGGGAVVDVARDPRLVFGPLLHYRLGRHDVSDPVVRKLPELDDAVEAGVRLTYSGDLGGGRLVAGVDYLHDVSGTHQGQTLQASLSFERPLSPRVVLGARGALTYADRDFMRSYYGVDGRAEPSGLPRYAPDPGLQAGEVGLSLRWSLDPRWSVIGSAAYERLMDEAAGSPLVRLRGSRNQTSLALGVVRRF
ncbi:MipA/OmpV family protein [Caulobacter sp. UNC279MFTsu5.1]|uniref:MipA/OmpV family protein n=1 Tax=Caulobacter sp. UNC279MFTsu5.1 TaxID=1502775 RepID=UPI0008F3959F|nr:MipA/OmpV family protein [Caulobacter sp. UNC279MFTsu5.1]SFK16005.1 Outer membrane scaffolding protein for murein synthesis, MipA/OmpV family [Caulobacter sp. UNC279MFTsu5.1]